MPYIRKIFSISSNVSVALSIVMHLAIVALVIVSISGEAISLPQQQIIPVEFIAMQEGMPAPESEEAPEPDVSSEVKNPEIKEKKQKKTQTKKRDIRKNKPAHSASGDAPSNADLTQNATLTEPVFNAAYLNNSPPVYPPAARKSNIEGEVLLKVQVSVTGKAEEVNIAKSSGSDLLDAAAVNAVKQWKFIPAKQGNNNVAVSVIVPVVFKIKN